MPTREEILDELRRRRRGMLPSPVSGALGGRDVLDTLLPYLKARGMLSRPVPPPPPPPRDEPPPPPPLIAIPGGGSGGFLP